MIGWHFRSALTVAIATLGQRSVLGNFVQEEGSADVGQQHRYLANYPMPWLISISGAMDENRVRLDQ